MELKNCSLCYEPIIDPVCINCFINHVRIWIDEKEINQHLKEFVLNKLRLAFSDDSMNDIRCILCNRNEVDVCFNCFFYSTSVILRELLFNDKMIKEFMDAFKFNSYQNIINTEYEENDSNYFLKGGH